jgi:hypothetical protein
VKITNINCILVANGYRILVKVKGSVEFVQESSTKVEFLKILRSRCQLEEKFVISISVNLNVIGRIENCIELV